MIRIITFPDVLRGTQQRSLSYPLMWTMLGVFVALLGSGCTHDHKIDLNPEIFVRVSNIGKGERLVVRVKDTRSQSAISKKESSLKVISDRAIDTVNIYASSSVRDTVLEKIMGGFERMGFHPSKHGNHSSRMITVEISKLQLNYQSGKIGIKIPDVHALMETILRVQARHGDLSFKNIYSTRMTKSHRMLTGKFKNERLVNNSLSMAIQKMFDDPELLQFLLRGI
ncbi:MAG: YajG family lipoprotein [Nitrospinaceae bacterium]